MFRLGVQDRANSGLTTLPSELLLYFTKVNRVHDNDIIGAVFAQKCRRHNSLPGTGKKFADAGLQIAPGVPLQCDEPEDVRTFRIGLFGLDKLHDVEGTVARLAKALDSIL